MTDVPAKKSDLGTRTLSAIAMLAVAGGALWLGGWVWLVFVVAVALGVLWEWCGLVQRFAVSSFEIAIWILCGFLYISIATWALVEMRAGPMLALLVAGSVVTTDVGAYFAGRAIGGPKIAPRISPSKTWAGLAGGIFLTALFLTSFAWWLSEGDEIFYIEVVIGIAVAAVVVAVLAQAGDFFESWMKRKAGVKDSGSLIPGHGGLFDRADGLLAVAAFGYPLLHWVILA